MNTIEIFQRQKNTTTTTKRKHRDDLHNKMKKNEEKCVCIFCTVCIYIARIEYKRGCYDGSIGLALHCSPWKQQQRKKKEERVEQTGEEVEKKKWKTHFNFKLFTQLQILCTCT